MKRIKFTGLFLALGAIVLWLSACFIAPNGQEDEGTFSITIGGSNARATAGPDWLDVGDGGLEALVHTIEISDESGVVRYQANGIKYGDKRSFSVAPGFYKFKVEAFYGEGADPVAIGRAEQTIHSGPNPPIAITMGPPDWYFTEGLIFELITEGSNANTYCVRAGTVTDGVVVIPAEYNGLPVTEIGNASDSVMDGAFYNIRITAVYIPESVTSIGNCAFANCSYLAGVTFASGSQLEIIGNQAFSYCPLAGITIPDSVTTIGYNAFSYIRSLTSITIPSSVKSMGSGVFTYWGNTSQTIYIKGYPNQAAADAAWGAAWREGCSAEIVYGDGTPTTFKVSSTTEWKNALSQISGKAGNYTITINNTISVPGQNAYTFGTTQSGNLTVTLNGSGTLSLNGDSTGSLLRIGANQTVTIDNLTLKGNNNNTVQLVYIDTGGTFNMNGGEISGNTNKTEYSGGGGVYVHTGGEFNMDGGTISYNENAVSWGGGVYVHTGGTFNMTGGEISHNKAVTGGSGVFVNQGTFKMEGGKISENETTAGYGGGVSVWDEGSIFTMTNGEICENKATGGGGVFVKGTFTMSGDAKVSDNIAKTQSGGGVDVLGEGSIFTMISGTISGNKAGECGGGVYVETKFIMNGGTISGNTASLAGGGVHTGDDSTFLITNGVIYGSNESETLRNTAKDPPSSAALNGTAEYGTFSGTTWNKKGSLTTTDDTIRVENGEVTPELAYELINNGTAYRVKKGTVTSGAVVIPAEYNGKPVTEIGSASDVVDSAAFSKTSITAVYIPESVTSISRFAFYSCTSLAGITIPSSVTSIGMGAFYECTSFTAVTIPSSVTSIDKDTFAFCTNLTSVTIPNGVTSIGESAFWACSSLTSVTIPASVTSIAQYAFSQCTSLTSVKFERAGVTFDSSGSFDSFPSAASLRTAYTAGGAGTYIRTDTTWANETAATTFTVTFDANGGSGTPPTAQTANASSSITLPSGSGLTKTGYTFGGWNTNSSGTGTNYAAGASYTVNGTITLYAKWTPAAVAPEIEGMVWVPGGSFEMGKDLGTAAIEDAIPVHTVTLTGFYMGKTEVTQAQYRAVMGSNPANDYGVGDNNPVYSVSWYDAVEFCNALSVQEGLTPYYTISKTVSDQNNTNSNDPYKWLVMGNSSANGYRLPTEAQWEYAAKGGDPTAAGWTGYTYAGSDNPDDVAWYGMDWNSDYRTHEVGTKKANGLGLYDMSGNVMEWCWDWEESYTDDNTQVDPTGASSGYSRVIRGGGWHYSAYGVRSAGRSGAGPDGGRVENYGFRLVRPAQ